MTTRREFVGLLAGSSATGLLPGCATWPAQSTAYNDGFKRARPESVGVSPAVGTRVEVRERGLFGWN